MTQENPVHPSRNLIQQWLGDYFGCPVSGEISDSELYLATQAARWGADQELEACCADLRMVLGPDQAAWLGSVRRPKPPSLKEQALEALDEEHADMRIQNYKLIRSVLESLPD